MFSCWFWWWGLSTATAGLKVRVVNTTRRRLIKVRLLYSTRRTQPYESMNNVTVRSSKWEAYDFLYLAMQWPMSFCNMAGVTCRRQIIPNYFTVHGLWPQKNRWQLVNCTVLLQHSHRGRGYPPFNITMVLYVCIQQIIHVIVIITHYYIYNI